MEVFDNPVYQIKYMKIAGEFGWGGVEGWGEKAHNCN